MKRERIGELEELVLLVVVYLEEEAYGNAIQEALIREADRNIKLSAIHSTLYRLEEKGMLTACFGDATQKRGGKRKKIFSITPAGSKALRTVKEIRNQLWLKIDSLNLQL